MHSRFASAPAVNSNLNVDPLQNRNLKGNKQSWSSVLKRGAPHQNEINKEQQHGPRYAISRTVAVPGGRSSFPQNIPIVQSTNDHLKNQNHHIQRNEQYHRRFQNFHRFSNGNSTSSSWASKAGSGSFPGNNLNSIPRRHDNNDKEGRNEDFIVGGQRSRSGTVGTENADLNSMDSHASSFGFSPDLRLTTTTEAKEDTNQNMFGFNAQSVLRDMRGTQMYTHKDKDRSSVISGKSVGNDTKSTKNTMASFGLPSLDIDWLDNGAESPDMLDQKKAGPKQVGPKQPRENLNKKPSLWETEGDLFPLMDHIDDSQPNDSVTFGNKGLHVANVDESPFERNSFNNLAKNKESIGNMALHSNDTLDEPPTHSRVPSSMNVTHMLRTKSDGGSTFSATKISHIAKQAYRRGASTASTGTKKQLRKMMSDDRELKGNVGKINMQSFKEMRGMQHSRRQSSFTAMNDILQGTGISNVFDHQPSIERNGEIYIEQRDVMLDSAIENARGHLDTPPQGHELTEDMRPPRARELTEPLDNPTVYTVEFKHGRKEIFVGHTPTSLNFGKYGPLFIGGRVKVEADRGEDLGYIIRMEAPEDWVHRPELDDKKAQKFKDKLLAGTSEFDLQSLSKKYKRVLRLATPDELALIPGMRKEEEECLAVCRRKVQARSLPMKVVGAEYQFDRHKLTFFFEASKRIDFRQLVRDLFSIYKTRIWLQQLSAPVSNSGNTSPKDRNLFFGSAEQENIKGESHLVDGNLRRTLHEQSPNAKR